MKDSLPDDFDPAEYLRLHKDVADAGISAVRHYIEHGRQEGRQYKRLPPTGSLPDRPVFFCHLPKTAGTTVRLALEAAFPAHSVLPDRMMMARAGGVYPPVDLVGDVIRHQRAAVRLLVGHYHYSCRSLLVDPITIAVMREPIARVISNIRHNMQVNGLSASEVRASLDRGSLPGVPDNQQTRYFGGHISCAKHSDLMNRPIDDPRARLSSAIENTATVDILGLDGLEGIASALRGIGVSIDETQRHNASRASIDLSDRHRGIIAELNSLDVELYRTVKDRRRQG